MKIAKNFTWKEVACNNGNCIHCGGVSAIAPSLMIIAQEIRDNAGTRIRVGSGFRCLKHNAAVGGVENSLHTKGLAIDLYPPETGWLVNLKPFQEYVCGRYFYENFDRHKQISGIGFYHWGVHIDQRHLIGMGPKFWKGK